MGIVFQVLFSRYFQEFPGIVSRYFLAFPQYKHCVADISTDSKQDDSDTAVCTNIAHFVYTQQIVGQFFLDSFTKKDFEELLSFSLPNAYDHSSVEWIWRILSYSINFSLNVTKSADEMEWISSSWTRHQIVSMAEDQCPQSTEQTLSKSDDDIVSSINTGETTDDLNTASVLDGHRLNICVSSLDEDRMSFTDRMIGPRLFVPTLTLSPFQSETDLVHHGEEDPFECEVTPRVQ